MIVIAQGKVEGHIPCILDGRHYPMQICLEAISLAFLMEAISYEDLFWGHILCVFAGKAIPKLHPALTSCQSIVRWHLAQIFWEGTTQCKLAAVPYLVQICLEGGIQCTTAACVLHLFLSQSQLCRMCAGTVRGVWLHGRQHVCTFHLWGGCAGKHVHWERHSPWQGCSSTGPRAHPRQESGNTDDCNCCFCSTLLN